jgi:crotonobetainyl-CoA:carnitine CoA-transferase CaiB-like acyl-CoA transferase
LSLTQSWTGPLASMLLGDLGAEVLRLEQIQYAGGLTRGVGAYPNEKRWLNNKNGGVMQYVDRKPWGPNGEYPWNRFSFGNCHLQNTCSFTLDFTRPKGWKLLEQIIKISDIFIENNTPTTLPKLGLTWEFFQKINPQLIFIRSPGLGLEGSHSHWKGFGRNIEAAIGHTWLYRYSEKPEHLISNRQTYLMDNMAAHSVAMAALMALLNREQSGKGCHIEVAQAEAAMGALPVAWMDYFVNGRMQPSQGNKLPTALQGCYPAAGDDQWVVITINSDEEWKNFCEAIDSPHLAKDPRFDNLLGRLKNQDILDKKITKWTRMHNNYEIMRLLQAHGVPAGPVMNEAMSFQDKQLKDRHFFIEETQKWCGTHMYTGYTAKYTRTPRKNRADMPPCGLGEHNEYVFKKLLKLSDEEYAELEREKYIGTEFLAKAKASL